MALAFYPHPDNVAQGSLNERVEVLMHAAERYKALVLEMTPAPKAESDEIARRGGIPRDQSIAYNWDEIAQVLRAIRELPEINKHDKTAKAELLSSLAEIYEVLRSAKMSKLEAVRLALISEATQLRNSASQVA